MPPRRDTGKTRGTKANVRRKHEEPEQTGTTPSPRTSIRDPSIPISIPTTAREPPLIIERKSKCRSGAEGCFNYIYNSEERTICERSCGSWCKIIAYSIMYIIFLSTYTMIFLYSSLEIIKATTGYSEGETKNTDRLIFLKNGVGLTATPTSVGSDGRALIWYRSGEEKDYQKYVRAIDELLSSRIKTPELLKKLGPCGEPPYGYGSKPCVFVRINKQLNWAGKPLTPNSTLMRSAPDEVTKWVNSGKKMLWLHCKGYDTYDHEHLGEISYHPYPPGFDPSLYPLDSKALSPLVAVQFSNVTQGVSLSVVCKLWYELGPSSVHFTLFVAPRSKQTSVT